MVACVVSGNSVATQVLFAIVLIGYVLNDGVVFLIMKKNSFGLEKKQMLIQIIINIIFLILSGTVFIIEKSRTIIGNDIQNMENSLDYVIGIFYFFIYFKMTVVILEIANWAY